MTIPRVGGVVAGLLAVSCLVWAADQPKPEGMTCGSEAGMPAGPVLKQKTCPVSGKPIRQDKLAEHKGTKVYFCGDGCVARFKESPEKYLPAVYRQVHPQSVQVKCPVMGDAVDRKYFADHEGHRVYFCCGGCDEKFKADPAKYVAKLKDVSTQQVHCPVSGGPINPSVSTEHEGKTVYFCCKDCVPKFKAEPGKYADALRPEAGLLARGATAGDDIILCPVCAAGGGGRHIRSQLKPLVHEGKAYFMCSAGCAEQFKSDPGKYLKVLEAEMKKQQEAQQGPGPKGGKASEHHHL